MEPCGILVFKNMEYAEKRRSCRAKVTQPLRVRPSEPRDEHFDEVPVSVNVSRDGIYFVSRRSSYYLGMRLFITFPYVSLNDPTNCEYVGEVVRVEKLPNNRFGIAVHFALTLNYSAGSPAGSQSGR